MSRLLANIIRGPDPMPLHSAVHPNFAKRPSAQSVIGSSLPRYRIRGDGRRPVWLVDRNQIYKPAS